MSYLALGGIGPVRNGEVRCRECRRGFYIGFGGAYAEHFSCGDCSERRTPLLREISELEDECNRLGKIVNAARQYMHDWMWEEDTLEESGDDLAKALNEYDGRAADAD